MASKAKKKVAKKRKGLKKAAAKRKGAKKQKSPRKIAPKKAAARGKAAKKATPAAQIARKKPAPKKAKASKKTIRGKSEEVETVTLEPKGLGSRSGGQAGDLQGLSNAEGADSESVDELLEEGNAFEAEVVKGVEDAGDADEGEVRTHEVPEDDVREEYLERDK